MRLERCPAAGYSLHVIGVADMKEAAKHKFTGSIEAPYTTFFHLYSFSRGNDLLVEWAIENMQQNDYCGGRPDMRAGWAFHVTNMVMVEQIRNHFTEALRTHSLPTKRDQCRNIIDGALPMMARFLALRDDSDFFHYIQFRVFDRDG
jgi:hypothetical protein